MNLDEILLEEDIEKYCFFFISISSTERDKQLIDWENKISEGNYNPYQFLSFLTILDIMDDPEDTMDNLLLVNDSIQEINELLNETLDNYKGSESNHLLDDMNNNLLECELLFKYYSNKLIC